MPKFPYKQMGINIDRQFRNDLNQTLLDIESDIKELNGAQLEALEAAQEAESQALYAKQEADKAAQRITELEGVDAVQFKNRQDEFDAQLAETTHHLEDQGFSVKHFEHLVVNGDWTEAFKATAQAIKGTNRVFFIPDERFTLSDGIEIYNSVECRGVLVWNGYLSQNVPRFLTFPRTNSPITLDVSLLNGLTEGSASISGLNDYMGDTLYLTSSEEIIKRADGNNPYTKKDTSLITDDLGAINPPLSCSYEDKTKLFAYVYPKEKKLITNGLTIEINSNLDLTLTNVISTERSNVIHNDLTINNLSVSKFDTGLAILNSTDVTVNRPLIIGTKETDTKGYGITISQSSLVNINDGRIDHARHAISGVNSKNVNIIGGSYSQIDCHYGFDYVIDRVISKKDVWFAGKNITIKNSKITESRRILSIRNDTPEVIGKVIIDNIEIEDAARVEFITYTSATLSFDFGRTLKNPDFVLIKNIKAKSDDMVYFIYIPANRTYNQESWGDIIIDDVKCSKTDGISNSVASGLHITRCETWIQGNTGSITIRNIMLKNNNMCELQFRSYSSTIDEQKMFDLYVENIKGGSLLLKVDSTAVRNVTINEVLIKGIAYFYARVQNKDWYFNNCTVDGVAVQTSGLLHFRNCLFKGILSGLTTSVKSSMNNIATIDCTGYPTLNGYVDTSLYKTS